MRFLITVSGAKQTIEHMDGMRDRVLDMTEAMQTIQHGMLLSAQETFLAGGRPDGWVPLSTATIKRRRNKDKSTIETLRDTGYLMQSLSPDYTNSYSIRRVTTHSAAIGTNRPGASAHQEGTGNVPQRKFLIHQTQDIEDYKQIILDHIVGFGR